jgi:hypothetical protein
LLLLLLCVVFLVQPVRPSAPLLPVHTIKSRALFHLLLLMLLLLLRYYSQCPGYRAFTPLSTWGHDAPSWHQPTSPTGRSDTEEPAGGEGGGDYPGGGGGGGSSPEEEEEEEGAPVEGEFRCAAVYPAATTSLSLGRKNLHLFRWVAWQRCQRAPERKQRGGEGGLHLAAVLRVHNIIVLIVVLLLHHEQTTSVAAHVGGVPGTCRAQQEGWQQGPQLTPLGGAPSKWGPVSNTPWDAGQLCPPLPLTTGALATHPVWHPLHATALPQPLPAAGSRTTALT